MVDLPAIDVTHRETRVHQSLTAAGIDALLITSLTNIRWLTGFAGSNAVVAVREDDITLFTDSRYADRAPMELGDACSTADIVVERAALGDAVRGVLGGFESVGLEADHVTWSQQRLIASSWLPDQRLEPTEALIEQLRADKDRAEIARIEAAAEIVDRALGEVRHELGSGLTERMFARRLDAAIRAAGADDLAFDTIVASGPNGAIPHHAPGDREISPGDLVIIDVGAMIDGYRSDMTRTFAIGAMTADQQRHYDTVIAAQQAGVEAMVADVATATVDAAARGVIADEGWGEHFTHGTGHGVGLDIHELPRVAAAATDRYRLGTVATVEPGVYLRGVGGVRIEDTCVVTPTGARRLTKFPKDLPVVC